MNKNILIFGSCVSRDILNFDTEEHITLVDYYARSSFASAFHPKIILDSYSNHLASAFQRRIVHADLVKDFSYALTNLSFDNLLIDLIDERFDLFVFHSGQICTLSNELIASGFEYKHDLGRKVKSGSEEFFLLWEQGWIRFVQILQELGKLDTIRINKVYWAEKTMEGMDFLPHYSAQQIKEANQFLDRLYTRISLDLPDSQFLHFEKSLMLGTTEHRWGLSPFHYIDDYYMQAAKYLIKSSQSEPSFLSDRVVQHWNEFSFSGHQIDLKSITGNCIVNQEKNYAVALFQGDEGSYQFRLKLPKAELSNGIGARFRLRGWKSLRYVAVGYTHNDSFRHVKITNAAREKWIDFSIGHGDIAYGLQNNWDEPPATEIIDIRLYFRGTPDIEGAYLDIEKLWCWYETEGIPAPVIQKIKPVSSELLDIIYDYLNKCFRTVEEQAEEFLAKGTCPLYGETMLKWSADSPLPDDLSQVGTYQFSWHALHPATILMLYARMKGTVAPLYAAREMITNWLERSYFQPDENKKFAWYDHGTAERLLAMILMWSAGIEQNFDFRFMARLQSAIFRHAQLLESELFYASHQPTRYHNHAWFQDLALMVAALAMPDVPSANRWLETAFSRLTDQLNVLIVRDNGFAIFVENSIGYHNGVQRIVEFAGNLVSFTGKQSTIPNIAHELAEFSKFLRYPDNRSPAQGDTFRRSNHADGRVRISRAYKQPTYTILPKAGYGVVKGNHEGTSFMLTLFATSLCRTHKHEDNLSFTLFFDGIEWLIDPSFYSHEYQAPIPAYLRSAMAHNCLALTNRDYSIEPGLAKLNGSLNGVEFLFHGEHRSYQDIVIQRAIHGRLDQLNLNFTDAAMSECPLPNAELCLMLHCGEQVDAVLEEESLILSHPDSNFRLVISLPTDIIHISFNEGDSKPVRGITGVGFMQHTAINTITCKVSLNEILRWNLRVIEK